MRIRTVRMTTRWVRIINRTLPVLYLMIMATTANPQERLSPDEDALDHALVQEDWARVVAIPVSMDDNTLPAHFRLIRAHAYLALNRNNESTCLFLEASPDGLWQWDTWTAAYVSKHSDVAIAHYFRGDALARLERWELALASFNVALSHNPTHVLALNARGVVYAIQNKWDSSLLDLKKATLVRPTFADAFASVGAMWIQRKEGPRGALLSLETALQLSPDFALALYGRGCLRSIEARWAESQTDLEQAIKSSHCAGPVVAETVIAMLERVGQMAEQPVAGLPADNPSMSVHTILSQMQRGEIRPSTGLQRLGLIAQNFPQYQPAIAAGLRDLAIADPVQRQHVVQFAANNLQTSRYYDALGKTVQALGGSALHPALKGIAAVATGVVSASQPQLANRMQFSHQILNALPSQFNPASGFKTNLENAAWDEGEWPFNALYGLNYKTTPKPRIESLRQR